MSTPEYSQTLSINYLPIKWKNGFEKWDLVRFSTPMDGNCLFHAISNSYFEPYRKQSLNGKPMSRRKMVRQLRTELSEKLAAKVDENKSDSPRYYDLLNYGNTAIFAKGVSEFSLEHMQSMLDSEQQIGYGYLEFLCESLNKDIYILEGSRGDIYNTDELPLMIKGNRRSIVLYYVTGHYELVGIKNGSDSFDTHFAPDHSFIRFLNHRVREIINIS